jgi:hypothetical protein
MTHPRLKISDEERTRRLETVKHARASVGLEGFVIPPEEEEHAQRYVDGEIDLDEYLNTEYKPKNK